MDLGKEVIPVCCCPWCKKLPRFRMWLNSETWLPQLVCENPECTVRPESRYVPIRKKQKYCGKTVGEKICKMINLWNEGHPYRPTEGFEFDFYEVAKKEAERDGFR